MKNSVDEKNLRPWGDKLTFACAILLAPVWVPLVPIREAVARRRWRRFHAVKHIEVEGDVVVLHVESGAELRVELADVGHAVASGWGDGSNGTDYEASLVVDSLRLRGSPETLSPLKVALAERGALRDSPWARPHPLDRSFNGFRWLIFVAMVMVYAIVACFLFISRAWALAIVAGIAFFILSEHWSSRRSR